MKLRRIAYALGAEVTGLDLRRPLDDAAVAELRAAWLDHLLLYFPDQELQRDELLAFARRFGEPEDVTQQNSATDASYVNLITNKAVNGQAWDGYKQGQDWHSDQSFTTDPTVATFVLCRETPIGGDTMFANMYAAYESLSPAMRRIVDGLWAVHDAAYIKNLDIKGSDWVEQIRRMHPPTAQPVARVHPETQRPALYVGDRVRQIVGMTDEESASLLSFLNARAVAYEFTYRHRWSPSDLVMWDNRCLLHVALCDYDIRRDARHMLRCAVTGFSSGYHVERGRAHDAPLSGPVKA